MDASARAADHARTYRSDGTMLAVSLAVIAASLVLRLESTGVHAVRLLGICLPDVCPVHRISGFWCPGCGLTRSFVAAAHGDFAAAIKLHPLGPILFSLVLLQVPYRAARLTGFSVAGVQRLTDISACIGDVLLISLLLLGAWRLAWGMTPGALTNASAAPPSSVGLCMSLLSAAACTRFIIALRRRAAAMHLRVDAARSAAAVQQPRLRSKQRRSPAAEGTTGSLSPP